jgi:hypothetical protein
MHNEIWRICMKKTLAVTVTALAVAIASPARADDSGLVLGIRASYAFPRGEVVTAAPLGDSVAGAVPLWFDLGYRFTKSIQVGGYFQYAGAFGLSRVASCPATGNCSSTSYRFGVEGIYTLMPDAGFGPWAGVGVGYELLGTNTEGADRTVRGFEFLNLQLGFDWRATKSFSIGPFASWSVGRFGTSSSGGVATAFTDTSTHGWLQAGLKTTINF